MEQMTQAKHYYTLTDAAKATGKDKRTLKKCREEGLLSGEPVMDGERIAGWKFDPSELARVFPETFRPLDQLEDAQPETNGQEPASSPTAPRGTAFDDLIRSYQAQIRSLQEFVAMSQENEKQTRREVREERESIRQERAGLHKIIETANQSVRLLTDERQRPAAPVTPPHLLTRAHYTYFGVIFALIAIGLLYTSFFKA